MPDGLSEIALGEPLALPYNILYDKGMTKPPLPRYITTVHLTVELSAKDYEDAEQRLDKIVGDIQSRLRKSTFRRLSGKPEVTYAEWDDAELN